MNKAEAVQALGMALVGLRFVDSTGMPDVSSLPLVIPLSGCSERGPGRRQTIWRKEAATTGAGHPACSWAFQARAVRSRSALRRPATPSDASLLVVSDRRGVSIRRGLIG